MRKIPSPKQPKTQVFQVTQVSWWSGVVLPLGLTLSLDIHLLLMIFCHHIKLEGKKTNKMEISTKMIMNLVTSIPQK